MGYLDMMKRDPDGGRALRQAWSQALCDRLSRTIAREAPEGIGRCESLWDEHMADPDDQLRSALNQWEETGAEADKRAARLAAKRVYFAWQQVLKRWNTERERAA